MQHLFVVLIHVVGAVHKKSLFPFQCLGSEPCFWLTVQAEKQTLFVRSRRHGGFALGTAHPRAGRDSRLAAELFSYRRLLVGKQIFLVVVKIRNVLEDQWSGTTPCSSPSHTPG